MRLIDADALYIDYLHPTTTTGATCHGYVSQIQINNAPTIEPQRMRGRWEYVDYGGVGNYHCSACRSICISKGDYDFCPHCGAWMGGQDE